MTTLYNFRCLGMLGQMYDEAGEEADVPSGTDFVLASESRAELTQLRGNLSLAEEGLANAMQEIGLLQSRLEGSQAAAAVGEREVERLRAQIAEMKRCTFGGSYGRCKLEAGHDGRHDLVSPSDEPCEHLYGQDREWKWSQACQCPRCKQVTDQFRFDQQMRDAEKSEGAPRGSGSEAGARCYFGGNYGWCELEPGHAGPHKLATSPRTGE